MLKRKAIASIKNWVNTKNKKCLVVQGARQTGKTYIIERFAEDNYEELLEINFKQMVSEVDIIYGDLSFVFLAFVFLLLFCFFRICC